MSQRLAVVQSTTSSRVEEQRHHAADAGQPVRDAGRRGRTAQGPSASRAPRRFEPRDKGGLVASSCERGDAGGGGQRIAAQRAGLKDFAGRQHVVHDVGPAAVGADRQAAADDLAQRGQIGRDAEQRLGAAIGHAKAGHHLVEDQQRAVPLRSARARADRNSRVGTTQPMLPTTGSTITAAICAPCSLKGSFERLRIVVGQHERVLGRAGGDARRIGHAQRGGRTAGGHQQAVDVAVIVAGELEITSRPVKPRARRMALIVASVPELTSRTFSIEGTASMINSASSLSASVGAPKLVPRTAASLHRRDHLRMGMPQNHRPPGADVVDVAIAIEIVEIGPCGALEEDRLAADAAKRPGRTVHAARASGAWRGRRRHGFCGVRGWQVRACRRIYGCVRAFANRCLRLSHLAPAASLAQ